MALLNYKDSQGNWQPVDNLIITDPSLTQSGISADAKAVGDKINDMVDYPIELGTYEEGKWIKWASGRSEYVATKTVTPGSWRAWGSIFQSNSFGVRFPSGLFVEPPDFFACIKGTPYKTGGSCLGVVTNIYETVTGQGDMFLYRPNTGGKEPSDVSIKAIGRWK